MNRSLGLSSGHAPAFPSLIDPDKSHQHEQPGGMCGFQYAATRPPAMPEQHEYRKYGYRSKGRECYLLCPYCLLPAAPSSRA